MNGNFVHATNDASHYTKPPTKPSTGGRWGGSGPPWPQKPRWPTP